MILSTKPGVTIGGNTLPVSYSKFTSMVKQGDTVFLGRYLVTGSEESSCYLTVRASCQALTIPPATSLCKTSSKVPDMFSCYLTVRASCQASWKILCYLTGHGPCQTP